MSLGEGLVRVALSNVHAVARAGADLPAVDADESVPTPWLEWLTRFDEVLEKAQQVTAGLDPAVHGSLVELRGQLDGSVSWTPGSRLVVDADDAQAVAVQALRLCEEWARGSARAG